MVRACHYGILFGGEKKEKNLCLWRPSRLIKIGGVPLLIGAVLRLVDVCNGRIWFRILPKGAGFKLLVEATLMVFARLFHGTIKRLYSIYWTFCGNESPLRKFILLVFQLLVISARFYSYRGIKGDKKTIISYYGVQITIFVFSIVDVNLMWYSQKNIFAAPNAQQCLSGLKSRK